MPLGVNKDIGTKEICAKFLHTQEIFSLWWHPPKAGLVSPAEFDLLAKFLCIKFPAWDVSHPDSIWDQLSQGFLKKLRMRGIIFTSGFPVKRTLQDQILVGRSGKNWCARNSGGVCIKLRIKSCWALTQVPSIHPLVCLPALPLSNG